MSILPQKSGTHPENNHGIWQQSHMYVADIDCSVIGFFMHHRSNMAKCDSHGGARSSRQRASQMEIRIRDFEYIIKTLIGSKSHDTLIARSTPGNGSWDFRWRVASTTFATVRQHRCDVYSTSWRNRRTLRAYIFAPSFYQSQSPPSRLTICSQQTN
jgi:hypothetical protein